jgi:putative SOS response-associated peptidase YedK
VGEGHQGGALHQRARGDCRRQARIPRRAQAAAPQGRRAVLVREHNEKLQAETCTIVTATPNATVVPIHDRMPVLLAPEDYDARLDTSGPQEHALTLLKPCPEDWLRVYRVSRTVDSVKNNGPECAAPA